MIDITRWTVDLTGRSGDEHLSLMLGHPVAIVRAYLKIEVENARRPPENAFTAVPVKLGNLGHGQDGLLGYLFGDDLSRVHVVDPAVAELAPGLPTVRLAPKHRPPPHHWALTRSTRHTWTPPASAT